MASLNKVSLIGNLGRDPDIRKMPNGDTVVNITVATTDSWVDKNSGEKKESTEWHRIVFYRGLADIVGKYLKKGASVYLEGKLHTRKWTDKDGVERYTTEIIADVMKMLGGRGADNGHDGDATDTQEGGGFSATGDEWLDSYDREMAAESVKPTPPRGARK